MGVSREDIFKAVERTGTARDLDRLVEITGASEGCGTCINELYACFQEALSRIPLSKRKDLKKGQASLPFMEGELSPKE